MKQHWRGLAGGWAPALAFALALSVPSSAQAADGQVQMTVTATNLEGGPDGSGFNFWANHVLYEPRDTLAGQEINFSDVGASARTAAAMGRFTAYWAEVDTYSASPYVTIDESFYDTIEPAAPNLAQGERITYTASLPVSASTAQFPYDSRYGLAKMYVELSIRYQTGKTHYITDRVMLKYNETVRRVLSVTYEARVGLPFAVSAKLRALADVGSGSFYSTRPRPPEMTGFTSASARLNKPTRLILTANKPGANITGNSGYVFE